MATDFEAKISEHTPALKSYLRRKLGSEMDAEDALQEILYNLFRTVGHDLDSINNLAAWLYRSARNLLCNLSRRQPMASLDETEFLSNLLSDGVDDQQMQLLRNLFWVELERALAQLPDEQRKVWELSELDGVPTREIAAITGVGQATVLSRKHYAVKHLRTQLRTLYNDIITTS